ncbi:MAG: heat-inducible transcriptional repressor HrcA [Firmicutes bacterium]|nr:heat-inducible transcriptional repressor HrcA [Bacillota bacterium]
MLTDRQMLILRMVVDDYVRSMEPVGSRTIAKHPELTLSAATIRNEMADLEELGYLEQPHTSAGRIPSQLGYRFYVDHLIKMHSKLSPTDVDSIKSLFGERVNEVERVAQQTAVILSGLTQYTSVVLGPQVYETTLRSLQIVPLSDHTAVVLVVTSSGQVQNRTVTFPEGISLRESQRLVKLLNDRLQGTPMYRIRSRMMEELSREISRHMEDYEEALRLLDQIVTVIDSEATEKVFLGGATNMLLQPEFRDVQKATPVLTWLEHKDRVGDALREEGSSGDKLKIRIGGENDIAMLQGCSVITATYQVGDNPFGVIGVIGPTRMDYGRVIALLDAMSQGLSDMYARLYKT